METLPVTVSQQHRLTDHHHSPVSGASSTSLSAHGLSHTHLTPTMCQASGSIQHCPNCPPNPRLVRASAPCSRWRSSQVHSLDLAGQPLHVQFLLPLWTAFLVFMSLQEGSRSEGACVKPDDLSSISRTWIVEKIHFCKLSSDLHCVLWHTITHTHTPHTHKVIKCFSKKLIFLTLLETIFKIS